jgi:hypothetical protein
MTITADEKRWQTESDARTLKDFAKLKRKPKRMLAARKFLKQEIKDSQKAIAKTT